MLLKPETRQMFVDVGSEAKACSQLENDHRDDEFLISRLIFLTTYGTNINLQKLIDDHKLASSIVANLSRHAEWSKAQERASSQVDPMEEMALVETLKLVFNVTRFCSQRIDAFAPAIRHIVTLLRSLSIPSQQKPLEPPFGTLVNALMNLHLDTKDAQASLYPADEPAAFAERLVELLDLSTKSYSENELEQTVTPLVCVISGVHEHAPENVREALRKKLLPTEEDRQGVLGQGDSLPARLLRNSTNLVTPELRKVISHLLFDLSNKDAGTFVTNVGYGFASGFLFENKIAVPESARQGQIAGGAGESGRAINPITGQFLDAESVPDLPAMTDEEKEREAERLFVLFERCAYCARAPPLISLTRYCRLKQLGVMSVENPVAQAVREGRFEQLPDDYDDDEDKTGSSSS